MDAHAAALGIHPQLALKAALRNATGTFAATTPPQRRGGARNDVDVEWAAALLPVCSTFDQMTVFRGKPTPH